MARKKKNRGHFKRGHDPRRHAFTTEERRRGGQTAFRRLSDERPWFLEWLQRKIGRTARPDTLARYAANRGRRHRGEAELPAAS